MKIRFLLSLVLCAATVGCGSDSDASPSTANADTTNTGTTNTGTNCTEATDVPRTVPMNVPTGALVEAVVTADRRCDGTAQLTVDVGDANYTILVSDHAATISTGGATVVSAAWQTGGGLTLTSAGGATVGHPLRPHLLLRTADIADFDATALTLLDWAALSKMMDLTGADPDGNDPAADAEPLPTALRFLQEHSPVFRMEKADLSSANAKALVAAMDGLMNDPAIIDFHHFELCHDDEHFFTGHDDFLDKMEAHLRSVTPALELPFGRMPWHEAGSKIPDEYATWSSIATDFYAKQNVCGDYPKRVCLPELKYTVKFSDPEVENLWACDPADQANWCDGLLLGHECSDLIGTKPEDYLGCEDNDNDGLPDQCPYGLLKRFTGERICDYKTTADLWVEFIDWHGQVHDRIGGAHGDHAMTPTTPSFWLYHVTINAVYEGYIRCP